MEPLCLSQNIAAIIEGIVNQQHLLLGSSDFKNFMSLQALLVHVFNRLTIHDKHGNSGFFVTSTSRLPQ